MAIFLAERIYVPVRYLGEQHVKEDLGRIPTVQQWLAPISPSVGYTASVCDR